MSGKLISLYRAGCLGNERKKHLYQCDTCSVVVRLSGSSIKTRHFIGYIDCFICQAAENKPTPRPTEEHIKNKKEEIRNNLAKKKSNV